MVIGVEVHTAQEPEELHNFTEAEEIQQLLNNHTAVLYFLEPASPHWPTKEKYERQESEDLLRKVRERVEQKDRIKKDALTSC